MDNKSIALLKWPRMIRSTPRCPCRVSFSSNSQWMGCLDQEYQFWQRVHRACWITLYVVFSDMYWCVFSIELNTVSTVTGSPAPTNLSLRFSWMGLVLLAAASIFKSFRQLSLRVTVGTGGGDRQVFVCKTSCVFWWHHSFNTDWWENVMENDCIWPRLEKLQSLFSERAWSRSDTLHLGVPSIFACEQQVGPSSERTLSARDDALPQDPRL